MAKKKGGAAPADTTKRKVVYLKVQARLAKYAEHSAKIVDRVGKILVGRGVAEKEIQGAVTALAELQMAINALPADWKLPIVGRSLKVIAVGAAVQLKEKQIEQYKDAVPATGLIVASVAGKMLGVKLDGTDAVAFVPRAHLELIPRPEAPAA